mgnify:CR=1 FL=1
MRTLTLIRKTVSPADPPVTLPCPPPKEAKAPSGQGAGQSGFSGPVPPMPQGPGELARYRLGGEGWVDLRQHQPGRRCGPGGFLASKIPGQCVRPPGGTPLPHRLGDEMGRERRPHPSGEAVGGTGPGRPAALKGGIYK